MSGPKEVVAQGQRKINQRGTQRQREKAKHTKGKAKAKGKGQRQKAKKGKGKEGAKAKARAKQRQRALFFGQEIRPTYCPEGGSQSSGWTRTPVNTENLRVPILAIW